MAKTKYESLKNPPAIEAVLDITTTEIAGTDIKELQSKNNVFKRHFPKMEQIHLFEGSIASAVEAGAKHQITYRDKPLGFTYKSEDEKEVAQFRVNGFSYNRLQPYPGWEEFVKAGTEQWEMYKKVRKKNLEIQRIGLRFINLIKMNGDNIADHFNIQLSFPEKTKLTKPKQFQYRYMVEFEALECLGIVNFALADSNEAEKNYVLDIDIIKQATNKPIEEKQILVYLEQMREAKNTIFFETLTTKTVKVYKWQKKPQLT